MPDWRQMLNAPANRPVASPMPGANMPAVGQQGGVNLALRDKVVPLFMQAVIMMSKAIAMDPALAPLGPKIEELGLTVADHYGMGQIARVQLDKAKEVYAMGRGTPPNAMSPRIVNSPTIAGINR